MSGRLLKKILKEQEAQQQQLQPPSSEDEDRDSHSPDSKKNPFDLLGNDDNDESDDQAVPESDFQSAAVDAQSRGNSEEQEKTLLASTLEVVSSSNHKPRKKKKKREKKESSHHNEIKKSSDFDEILENLLIDVKNENDHRIDHHSDIKEQTVSVLQVNQKYLNAEMELRRIFGSKVVKSFESSQVGSSRHTRGGRRGSHNSRKTILVTPLDHWPRWDASLSMEVLEARDGLNHLRYVHSLSYVQAQRAFEAAKATHDFNAVASVLLYHPYHLDSLLTIAEYFKIVGEHQMAADAIGKCLYALECAWHPLFPPWQGNIQLKYNHETNRPLFKTLFIHMNNLERRGCHRSALEVCKLLLSLDVDDPMGAMFCVDYFALRAEEYSWLEDFSEKYKSDNSLWLFPNFSFSLAICRFYLEQEDRQKDVHDNDAKSSSVDLLKQALMLHPSVLKKLVTKVPLKDQFWLKTVKHWFFRSENMEIPSLDHLISIYIERNYLIWRFPGLQKLLRDTVELVIETIETNRSDAEDWACVRKEAFASTKNEYSHLLVSDFSDSVASISPENMQQFMGEPGIGGGVLVQDQAANPAGGAHAVRNVADRSALAVLVESILPWVNYGGEDGDGGEDVERFNANAQDNAD